jgi:hypothetical protein
MGMPVKTTIYTLGVGGSAKIANSNQGRRSLVIQNIGAVNPVSIMTDANPGAAEGIGLDPASVAGGQGGSYERFGDDCPTNAFWAYSALGTKIVVQEG